MNSIWLSSDELPKFRKLDKDIKTDILIIGGGLAGILTAYFLEKNSVDYVLVEKDSICRETTGNTTAKITFQHGLIYDKIVKSKGLETAQKYMKANFDAFKMFECICKNIDCDYEKKDNYVYSIDNYNKLEKEMTALNKIGYKAVFCNDLPIPVKTVGAVKFPNQAQFNPIKFISAICSNLNIYENTFVREMKGTTAFTSEHKIIAKKVIVTTHFPFIDKHGLYPIKLYQHRSYVIALENGPDFNGMYVDENKSGLSFRNYKNNLLLGGGGHRTGKNGGNYNELRTFAKENFKNCPEKYNWAAQDCMSLDKIPYIGHYSSSTPNLLVASGFNKWGMTSSMVSAVILSDIILERKNDYLDVFNPSRAILHPQLFANTFESIVSLLTFSTKRCPHLGCALKYNNAEHSWDCPCHGSRFTIRGKVLNNPANGNLKK